MKKEYSAPDIKVVIVSLDIITYSEEDVWEGPAVDAEEDNA